MEDNRNEIRIVENDYESSMWKVFCSCGATTLVFKNNRHANCYWCNKVIDVKLEKQKIKDKQFRDKLAKEE